MALGISVIISVISRCERRGTDNPVPVEVIRGHDGFHDMTDDMTGRINIYIIITRFYIL